MNKQTVFSDNLLEWIIAGLALAAVIVFGRLGMPQKWNAAIVWTAVAFGPPLLARRKVWNSQSFWTSWAIYLILHSALMWVIFAYLLAKVKTLGMVFVVPFAAIEAFTILILLSKKQQPRPLQSKS
ncbi:MAG: hypothetical protein ABR976_13600 [Terracidiphilus sp.]|jgi:hypothetical protein